MTLYVFKCTSIYLKLDIVALFYVTEFLFL